ncbi:MAG: hypothetical protein A2133_08370 [Actinobacteria bacterium RBG_16_64_13]|nr:MAG: hypothetical protein A2133_08370 [Actinobacteria bacterium RBG_16_64_13]
MLKVAAAGLLVAIVAVAVALVFQYRESSAQVGGDKVAETVTYAKDPVEMVYLGELKPSGQAVSFSLAQVKTASLAAFTYTRSTPLSADFQAVMGGNVLPLISYVAPSGRLVVATSFCEPCRSYSFHIEGNELVCNTCFTRWSLDTLEGVSGGCQTFPPEELVATVSGDNVTVALGPLEAWQPRVSN